MHMLSDMTGLPDLPSMPPLPQPPLIPAMAFLFMTALAIMALSGCGAPSREPAVFEALIAPELEPDRAELPSLDGGTARRVGVIEGPDGRRDFFPVDEVILRPATPAELDDFLDRYAGVILRDGAPLPLPAGLESSQDGSGSASGITVELGSTTAGEGDALDPSGWYLIRIDPSRLTREGLETRMRMRGVVGRFRFSSPEALRLAALVAREGGLELSPNFLLFGACALCEHPDDAGGYLDAAGFWWLSPPVTRAWDYLRYLGLPTAGSSPPRLALVDGGFHLDEGTGAPLEGNRDYPPAPLQLDLLQRDFTAGGENPGSCIDGPCPWHGQTVFGIAAALPGNQFGTAGTGGAFVTPLLARVDGSIYLTGEAIRSAALSGAGVVNLSLEGACGWLCEAFPAGLEMLQDSVAAGLRSGAVVVAAAGNGGERADVSLPCRLGRTLCVGAAGESGTPRPWSPTGAAVDLFAPDCLLSTVTPESAALDADAVGGDELVEACGTSASAAFVSGVVGLMRVIDPGIDPETVRTLLQSTAARSPDPAAHTGMIDALAALLELRPNLPPTVRIDAPRQLDELPWGGPVALLAEVADPEPGARAEGLRVTWSSDVDGPLCDRSSCQAEGLSPGDHLLTVRVVDPFGGESSDTVRVRVANAAPQAFITYPAATSSYYVSQQVNLRGFAIDPGESIRPEQLTWTSDLDGRIGQGGDLWVRLSEGTHHVTLTATDADGLTGHYPLTLIIRPGAGWPTARILSPADGTPIVPADRVVLTGEGVDPEEGNLPDSRLEWYSNGYLGSGNRLEVSFPGSTLACTSAPATRPVMLRVIDRDGHQATHQIDLRIGAPCG